MSDDWSNVPVRGFRRWRFERGHLLGIAYPLPWAPGVNEAECPLVVSEIDHQGRVVERRWKPEPHTLQGCSHGFYARFRVNDDGSYYPVTGMIEGWGEVIAGPDGFRAEKAKIVALMLPDLPKKPRLKKWLWVGRRHFEIPEKFQSPEYPTKVIRDEDNRLVRKWFPDIPVFNSIEAMLKEFPIDRGEFPNEPADEEPSLTVRRGGITYTQANSATQAMSAALRAMELRRKNPNQ